MSSNSLSDNVFKSTVLSGLASLKSELAEVKSDLRCVEQKQQVGVSGGGAPTLLHTSQLPFVGARLV